MPLENHKNLARKFQFRQLIQRNRRLMFVSFSRRSSYLLIKFEFPDDSTASFGISLNWKWRSRNWSVKLKINKQKSFEEISRLGISSICEENWAARESYCKLTLIVWRKKSWKSLTITDGSRPVISKMMISSPRWLLRLSWAIQLPIRNVFPFNAHVRTQFVMEMNGTTTRSLEKSLPFIFR